MTSQLIIANVFVVESTICCHHLSKSIYLFYMLICKLNFADEGRKAETYGKFKLAILIIYGQLKILL
jgi:hypothetical protein